jgi:hypothetical protein
VTKISIRSIFNVLRLAILPALLLAGLAFHFWYWREVDLHGRIITCTVDRKEERIDRKQHDDSWTPAFRVSLACASRDTESYLAPAFDTDEQEFDRIQKGSPFEVRYLSSVPLPLLLVGINGAHLARETLPIHAARTFSWLIPASLIVGYLLVLSFLGWLMSKRGMKPAMWAFFAMLAIALIYILTPTLPVALSGKTAQATATIKEMRVHTLLSGGGGSRSRIEASVPYELLVLEFTPAGRREPLLAGDMIDVSSRPDLAVGQQVPIDYEVDHPRHANIQGAMRTYYWRNVQGAIVSGFATIALLLGATLAWQFIKQRAKQAMEQARERARDRAM